VVSNVGVQAEMRIVVARYGVNERARRGGGGVSKSGEHARVLNEVEEGGRRSGYRVAAK
jgi:hypothetical protein